MQKKGKMTWIRLFCPFLCATADKSSQPTLSSLPNTCGPTTTIIHMFGASSDTRSHTRRHYTRRHARAAHLAPARLARRRPLPQLGCRRQKWMGGALEVRREVDSSDSMIISSVTTRLSDAQPVAALREACPSSSGGTVGIRPRNLPHERTTKLITAGTPGSSAARNAVAPCSSPIRPMPDAWIRALTELLAAMPTSAHGPHCTLDAAWPRCRRHTPSESRQPFAAP